MLFDFCYWPRGYKHVHWTWSYPRIRVIILAVKQHNSSQVPPPCQGSRHARVIDFFISEIRDQLLTFNLGWLCSGVKNNERLSGIQWPIIETLRTSTLQMTSFDMMRTQVWKERWKLKKIFDIYIKILYLPHRAEGSQAVLEGVLMRWHQQTLRCRGCSPRIIVCFILISGHRILLVTRDTRHWTLDTSWTTALAFHYLPNYEPGPFYNIYPGICWCQLPAPRLP